MGEVVELVIEFVVELVAEILGSGISFKNRRKEKKQKMQEEKANGYQEFDY